MPENAHLKYLSIHLDSNGKRVFAASAPEGAPEPITLDELKQAVGAAGFGGYRLDERALEDAAARYTAGEAFKIVVGEAVDGRFDIRLDGNHLNAYLTCTLPLGGTPVTLERVLDEVRQKEIILGLNREAIEFALTEGGDNILIASGKAPISGVDGKFENLIPSAKARSPRLDEHGLADFRDLGEILVVHVGDRLMRRIPPTEGLAGVSVSGQPIPAKPGKRVTFGAKLNGTRFDHGNENLLIAAIDGYPVLRDDGVSVEEIYTVGDVDLRTGNINFPGTVNVTGDIHTGMTVKASGDIHVSSTVEGGILIAEGDIVVKGGIVGVTDRAGAKSRHSTITCKGSCSANFAQSAHISAGNGIFIRDFAMQSDLSAGHQIIVGDGSRKGHLMGGTARATMLVKAQVIGSPTRMKTVVIAGADLSMHERLSATAKARDAAADKLMKIAKLLEVAQANPGRLPTDTVKAAVATRDAINAEMIALDLDETELKNEIAAAEKAQVVAEKQFLEGVEIRFGPRRHQVVSDKIGGVFRLMDGELILV